MLVTRRQLVSAPALALLTPPVRSDERMSDPIFRRGGAIHTMMNWGALRENEPELYVPAPFDTPRNALPVDLLRNFAAAGFDFIRLTLDVGPFLQLQGAQKDALEQKLLDNIERLHELGLDVIVDCHPVEQVPVYSTPVILDDLEGKLFTDYTALIARLAALLARVKSGHVALELMNEPVVQQASHETQVRVWGAAQLVLHDAARRAAADLPLLLTGADYGGISGLADLDSSPFLDSNTLFSFHYYTPISFTHQGLDLGAPDAPSSPYVVDLPYPYDALSRHEIEARVEAHIAADTKLDSAGRAKVRDHAKSIVRRFLSDAWTRDRIEKDMARVAEWADSRGVKRQRVLMGECGVTGRNDHFTGANPVYRRAWLSDVTGIAEDKGFGWALWEINRPEFGIQGDPSRLDVEVLKALRRTL